MKHPEDPNRRIPLSRVQEIYPASETTIWRKQNDPNSGFPKPIYIGRIRYWKKSEVIAWLDAQPEVAA